MSAREIILAIRKYGIAEVDDLRAFCAALLRIQPESGQGLIPLAPNTVQRRFMEIKQAARAQGYRRFIVLKARRTGITTIQQAAWFRNIQLFGGLNYLTLAHTDDDCTAIARIGQRYYDHLPAALKHVRRSAHTRELDYPEMDSRMTTGTAGAHALRRGDTLQGVHGTEVAFWPALNIDTTIAGLQEAARQGEIILESTANGTGGLFHELWQASEDNAGKPAPHPEAYYPIFIPWWMDERNAIATTLTVADYSADEIELASRLGLSCAQVAWRRSKTATISARRVFPQEYPASPQEAFLTPGNTLIDPLALARLDGHVREPVSVWRGARIWREPVPGRVYVIGADVALGVPGGDWPYAVVLDDETCEHVASLRVQERPEMWARSLYALGQYYGWALLAVERNNHGHSTLNTLVNDLAYPALFYALGPRGEDCAGDPMHLGWDTSPKSRPIMLDNLRDLIEDGHVSTPDRILRSELGTFCYVSGKYQATTGAFDDGVIALAIALKVREQMPRSAVPMHFAEDRERKTYFD